MVRVLTCYRVTIRESRIATTLLHQTRFGHTSHESLCRSPLVRNRVAQLDLAPTLAVFVSRSVISKPPRFATDYSAAAMLAVVVEMHRLRTSDA
jgi:hypothetical protein